MSGSENQTAQQQADEEYRRSRAFLLACGGPANKGRFLELYEKLSAVYRDWDIPRGCTVEVSVKLGASRLCRQRYAIPFNLHFDMDIETTRCLLFALGVPKTLVEHIIQRHCAPIYLGLGVDVDNGLHKIYFTMPNKSICAYAYLDDGRFGEAEYVLRSPFEYRGVLDRVNALSDTPVFGADLRSAFPESSWTIVYERRNCASLHANGFHICPGSEVIVGKVKDQIRHIVASAGFDVSDQLESWLYAASSAKLYWVSLGFAPDRIAEFSLYARPGAG
jgi:hypothetical protein